jgi:hypothetical protein
MGTFIALLDARAGGDGLDEGIMELHRQPFEEARHGAMGGSSDNEWYIHVQSNSVTSILSLLGA